ARRHRLPARLMTAADLREAAPPLAPQRNGAGLAMPGPALLLGALALAPAAAFLGLILAARAGADIGGDPLPWLTGYAAIALAVTGGVRLGNGLRTGAARGRRGWMAAVGGGLTPLAAFAALVLPAQAGLGLLAFAWAALGAADSLAV